VQALIGWRREVFGADALRLKRGELALVLDGARVKVVDAAR
jgi:ribonuclease D